MPAPKAILGSNRYDWQGWLRVRIGTDIRKCVLFFGVPSPEGVTYGGTGFLAMHQSEGLFFLYLVTARHVAKALENYADTGFYIRANLKDGTSDLVTVEKAVWAFPDDPTIDLAIAPFGFEARNVDHQHIDLEAESVDLSDQRQVTCGDVISIVGLFRLHHGRKKSIPFVHTGHIAVMPDANEKVPVRDRTTNQMVESEVFLVEAQTLEGLSGSPVFVHEVLNLDFGKPKRVRAFGGVKLLGLYQGAWDGEPGEILAKDRNFRGAVRVPVGMGMVVPANKIIDLMKNHSDLRQQRERIVKAYKTKGAAATDSAIPVSRSSDANPTHREDFTRLLGAAVRKPEQAD